MIRMQERIQLNELTRFQASIELVFFRHPYALHARQGALWMLNPWFRKSVSESLPPNCGTVLDGEDLNR
jgi:hypothetical protein